MENGSLKKEKRLSVLFGASSKTHVRVLLGDMILNFKYLIVVQPLEKNCIEFLQKIKKLTTI